MELNKVIASRPLYANASNKPSDEIPLTLVDLSTAQRQPSRSQFRWRDLLVDDENQE
jgi:hypothetical protein